MLPACAASPSTTWDLARPVLARDLRDVPEGFVDPCVAVEHRATAATHPPSVFSLDDPEEQPARTASHTLPCKAPQTVGPKVPHDDPTAGCRADG
jgi:hypothetical protein